MGFFNFGNNSKAEIQSCALKISTGLGQIEQEYASSNGQATPMVKGIASALQNEVRTLERLLKPNGRICIITFHSLEDRIVKTKFRENENPCTCPPNFPVCVCGKKSKGKVITRKPIIPSEDEIEENKRAKSSKLRIFERC